MLVLTRAIEQELVIGDNGDIDVKICGIRDGKVSIGVEAPKEIPIWRREIYESIKQGGGSRSGR